VEKHRYNVRSKLKENTMRFMMVILRSDWPDTNKPAQIDDVAAFEEMGKYNDQLKKAGMLLAMDGLTPPSMGARLTYKDGKPKITDGPFAEAKEVIAGYWMIEVKSREEALEWALRIPCMNSTGTIEIRQVVEIADFDPEIRKKFVGKDVKLGNQR
jgi:hypothetical protein